MKLLITFVLGFKYYEDLEYPSEFILDSLGDSEKRRSYTGTIYNDSEAFKNENLIQPLLYLRSDVRIQYELPREGIKTINVLYLGNMAYISIDSTTVAIKCNIFECCSFLTFTVIHILKTNELTAPIMIRNRDIHFDFKLIEQPKAKLEIKSYYYVEDKKDSAFGYLIEHKSSRSPDKLNNIYVKVNSSDYLLRTTCKFHRGKVNMVVNDASLKIKEIQRQLELERLELERLEMERLEMEKLEREKLEMETSMALLDDEEYTKEVNSERDESEESSDKKMEKKGKNNKAPKSKKTNKLKKTDKTSKSEIDKTKTLEVRLNVTGDQLLYEKSVLNIGDINSTSDMLYTGLMFTTTQVLTSEQRIHYKTLSVNIKSIKDLPPSVTATHEIKTISMEYSFPPVCSTEIVEEKELVDLSKTKFAHYKTFLNDAIPNDKLIEAMQGGALLIKIYGHREKKYNDKDSQVWGQNFNCTNFSKLYNKITDLKEFEDAKLNTKKIKPVKEKNPKDKNTKDKNTKDKTTKDKNTKTGRGTSMKQQQQYQEDVDKESLIIGFAVVELYDLMLYTHRIVTFAQLQSTLLESPSQPTPLRPMNPMHFHNDVKTLLKGIVRKEEFTVHKSSLEVELKIGYNFSRNILSEVLTHPTLFTRCIIIENKPKSAYQLIKELLKFNKASLGDESCNLASYLQRLCLIPSVRPNKLPVSEVGIEENEEARERPRFHSINLPKNQNYCTGFLVDAIDYAILVLECLEIDAVAKIMLYRYEMTQEEGRMLYNSNLIFTERLYNDFAEFGGIFIASLGVPLDIILNHGQIGSWVPAPALRCLETLKRIKKAPRISQNLFPSPLELLSMFVEFCVPLHKSDIFL